MLFRLLRLFEKPKVAEKPIVSIENRILHLKLRTKYFENHATNQPLFLSEYETSKEILKVIETTDNMDENRLVEIVNIYNRITEVEHYNGSGWVDFQIKLGGFFHHYGYVTDFEERTGFMRIEKL